MYFMNMNMLDKGELNRRFDAVLDVMKIRLNRMDHQAPMLERH